MKLIIGGAYQGKLEYSVKTYKNIPVIDCTQNDFILDSEPAILNNFTDYCRNSPDTNIMKYLIDNAQLLSNKIIIFEDIFCGVVPISKPDRLFREQMGRASQYLANESEEVVRVFCGIGVKLK